jgi:S1-C subfamily serine protease
MSDTPSVTAPTPGPESPRLEKDDVRAFLESLTGPSRGRVTWLSSDDPHVTVGTDRVLRISSKDDASPDAKYRARLHWSGETYEIEASPETKIWVNGRKVGSAHLIHGDMIEFGEDGPMTRYRLCQNAFPTRWPIEEILSDTMAYARSSRRPFGPRLTNAFFQAGRRLLLETSLLFRLTVILVLVLLTIFVALQWRSDRLIQQSLETEALRLEAIATALAETRQKALSAEELETLREQLELQLGTNSERLKQLERRIGASARVIREATDSVVFLQGAFGLREIESGLLLRHVLNEEGMPLQTPLGRPLVDVNGNGEPLEFQFTGTGFLLADGGLLVTNRHVALPWAADDRLRGFQESGLEPEMLKLVAYFPGLEQPIDAVFLSASETADLAILSVTAATTAGRGLTLSEGTLEVGDEVIVMGFPTGLRALLAQAGRAFISELQDAGDTDFWTIAARLSEQNKIAPLASRGIIAQITPMAVIYDAETTIGGSGGPALDRNGHVVAINTAILPEFGGANIGVPVGELHRLLASMADK